jgi:hypothetical protein
MSSTRQRAEANASKGEASHFKRRMIDQSQPLDRRTAINEMAGKWRPV